MGLVQGAWLQLLKATHREYQRLTGAISRDPQLGNLPGLSQYQTQAAALAGHFVADIILYPLETVLHRLHLQGTRSIIDNLDSGIEVTPILTRYEGAGDCFSTILQEEGISGLFKGFGSVILQYAVHFLIIKFSSKIISQVAQIFSNPPNFLQDPRLSTEGESSSSAMGDTRSSPRLSKDAVSSKSPASVRRQLSSGFDFPSRDKFSFTGSSSMENVGFSDSKKRLNDVIESTEPESDSRFEPLFNPRPAGSSGFPSLLSFSNTSATSSPQRRLHPEKDFQFYNKH